MDKTRCLFCPICKTSNFLIKHQATYVYSYVIDSDAPGLNNSEEFLPFLYDNREQIDTKQYLECSGCGAVYPCFFNEWDRKVGLQELQYAINAHLDDTIGHNP